MSDIMLWRAEHAGFMDASRVDVRHTPTTQRNAWNGKLLLSSSCRLLFFFCLFLSLFFLSILALERRDSWEAEEQEEEEEDVCVCVLQERGGGQ